VKYRRYVVKISKNYRKVQTASDGKFYEVLADSEADRIVVIDGVGTEDQVFSEIRGVLEERVDAAFQGLPEEAAENAKPVESQATLWALLEEDGILL